MRDHNINPAAVVVLGVVGIVVLAYTGADVVNIVKTGQMPEASRQLFSGAVGALVAIIATTGKGNPPGALPVIVANDPANPVPTDPQT